MAWFLASLVLPVLAAYALVAWCDRESVNDAATRVLRLSLAIGIGLGLSSCSYFLWLFFVGTPGTLYHGCELALFAVAALLGLALARGNVTLSPAPAPVPTAVVRWQRLLCVALSVATVLAVAGAVGYYWKEPLGDFDAWLIWNQRARAIYLAGDDWRQAFSATYIHTDYPLLLPCGAARFWSYLGAERQWVPWLLGTLFTLATVGMLAAGVARLRSRCQGMLAGLALLGMVAFLQRGASQYADVPLAFFLLAAVLSLVLYDAAEHPRAGLLALSGLTAALAAWTKNEGLLLLLVLPAAHAAAVWRRGCTRKLAKELLVWGAGALPLLAVIAIQKGFLDGNNDLVEGQGLRASWSRLVDPARYWLIAQSLILNVFRTARPFVVVLPLCFLLLGPAKDRANIARGLRTAGAVLLLMLAGYFLVYVTTPADLQWHLKTSADRLLLQLWPLFLLILFLYLASPEELLATESKTPQRCEDCPSQLAQTPPSEVPDGPRQKKCE